MSTSLVDTTKATKWLTSPEASAKIGSALAGWMDNEHFVAQIIIAFQHPDIAACSEESKFKAAHVCASLQLLPSLNQVALIPRNCNIAEKGQPPEYELQCHVMPQWQGYKALMERNPDILDVEYDIVFEGERYRMDVTGFTHEYDPFGNRDVKKDLSNIKGGYLRVVYTDRNRPDKLHFVTLETICKAKACAQTKKVWDAWPGPMVIKTLYRDGYARRIVPIDTVVCSKLQRLTEVEDATLQNDPRRIPVNEKHRQQARQMADEDAAKQPPPPETDAVEDEAFQAYLNVIHSADDPAAIKAACSAMIEQTDDPESVIDAADLRLSELKGEK